MIVVRQAGVLLLAALLTSRGLFAQDSAAVATASPTDQVASPADQVKVLLRPTEIRYVHQESVLLPPTAKIKGLYVNAWAFGSPKLWQLVRLADETEINAFVVDVKDDTGCLLYPSAVATAQQIGANQCVRAKDARARLDTLNAHGIYPIARIVVAKDPLLAERKPQWSVKDRDTGGLWRDRINIAWVDAYNDSVWIYAAQLAQEAARMGFASVADVVLPMLYPSHYYRGAFGFAWPNGQPYRVVRSALNDALQRSRPLPGSAEIRPFLQAFTLGRRLPRYTPFEIREQIRAVEDLGITSWVLWNPRSVYQRAALRPKHASPSPAPRELSTASGGR